MIKIRLKSLIGYALCVLTVFFFLFSINSIIPLDGTYDLAYSIGNNIGAFAPAILCGGLAYALLNDEDRSLSIIEEEKKKSYEKEMAYHYLMGLKKLGINHRPQDTTKVPDHA